MLLYILENNLPLDEVVFYNTGMEFEAIYRIRDKIAKDLKRRGIKFTELHPARPFTYDMLERPVVSKQKGKHAGYGWCGGLCRWGTTEKILQRKVSSLVWSVDTNGRVSTIWRRAFAVVLVLIVASSWKCWIPERECSEKWNTSALSPLASSTRYSVTSVQRCTARSDNRQNTPSRRLCKGGLHPMARPRPLPDCVV